MKAKSKARRLRFESVEKRIMLDGNLAVSVLGGTLWITGDAASNVAVLSPAPGGAVGGTTGPTDSFVIAPDPTTSINGGTPGEALTVSGVTAGGRVDLGAGDDSLTIQGPCDFAGALSIQSGAGNDNLSISGLHSARLNVGSSQGNDTVAIDSSNVDTAVVLRAWQGTGSATLTGNTLGLSSSSADSPPLFSLLSTNFNVSLAGTDMRKAIAGKAVVSSFGSGGGTVSVADSWILDGGITVSSRGPLDFSMTRSVCDSDAYLKSNASTAKSPPNIVLQESSVAGDLTVLSQGAQHVVLHKFRGGGIRLNSASSSTRSTIEQTDVDCDGGISVACVGPADVSASSVRAADFFLKLDGIKGESFVDNTTLEHLTLTGGLSVSGSAAQNLSEKIIKLDFHTIKLTNTADSSRLSIGDLDGGGRLDIACAGPTDLSASSVRASDFFLKLDGIKGSSFVDNTALDDITLSGGLFVTGTAAQNLSERGVKAGFHIIKLPNSSIASRVSVGDLDCDGTLDIACAGPTDLSASSVRASDFFLKLDGIKGSSFVDNAALDHVTLTGGLFVSGSAAQNLSVDGIKGERMHIKLDNSNVQGRSAVALADVDLDGALDVACRGPVDFSGGGSGGLSGLSSRAVDMFLKFESLATQTSPSTLALHDWSLDGVLNVACRGALDFSIGADITAPDGTVGTVGGLRAADMFLKITDVKRAPESSFASLTDVVLSGDLRVAMGGGDDTVSVSACRVLGTTLLDGGAGSDTLVLAGNSFDAEPFQLRFEKIEMK
ncbi:MAG: hypothetical protein HUU20_28520 [Pirellulales bacterium]|nr:hypothetical protein [Pirellulales bacterium]